MEQEKSRKFIEWRPSDAGDTIGWALIFIWAAFLMLAPMLNIGLDWNSWGMFFIGLGTIGIAGALLRLLASDYPNPSLWDFVFALFFLFLGLGNQTGWIWALALIIIGFCILRSVHKHHKSNS